MADFYPEITLAAANLSVGDNVSINCPSCGRADKMSVGRKDEGVVYQCFSTNCGEKGFITDTGFQYKLEVKTRKPNLEIARYFGLAKAAEKKDIRFFNDAFGISFTKQNEVYITDDDEYLFPILDKSGFRVGEVIRQPKWAGVNSPREGQTGAPKARTYVEGHKLSWHNSNLMTGTIVLTEDQLSAIKVNQVTGLTAVALLGNNLNQGAWDEIRSTGVETVVWWLDKDVLANTYALCAQYGPTVGFSKVVYTEKDPKSCSPEQIKRVLLD